MMEFAEHDIATNNDNPKHGFRSLGEFALCVTKASFPGEDVDNRLKLSKPKICGDCRYYKSRGHCTFQPIPVSEHTTRRTEACVYGELKIDK